MGPGPLRRRAKGEWEAPGEAEVDEVRVARYRMLVQAGRYVRPSRDLAEHILDADLELLPGWRRRCAKA